MANFFDQFDGSPDKGSNFFDQFDQGAAPSGQPPMPDWYFEHGPHADVLNAMGQGAAEGWGAEPLHFGEDTTNFLRSAGLFDDLQKSHQNWLKTFNEVMLRPAASALATGMESVYRGGSAALRAGQAGVAALGERAEQGGLPGAAEIGRTLAAIPEAFPRGPRAELAQPVPRPPAPEPVASPEANARAVLALTPPDLAYARSLAVIGEGEAGWKGTVESGPRGDEARAAAIKQVREATPEEPEPAVPPPTPTPDIHQLARGIAPDAFRQYDTLGLQRDTLRRQIDDLDDMRREGTSPAIAPLDQLLNELRTQRSGETSRGARRDLAGQISVIEARRAELAKALPETGDTAEMAATRQRMAELDYQMRDLSPQVSAAYRAAQEPGVSRETPTAEPPVPPPEAPAAPEAAPTAEEPIPAPAPLPAEAIPGLDIRDNVRQQLIAAGRPPEEADAASALVAAHYDARAARFGGAKGTAQELYTAEAPQIEAAAKGRKGEAGRTVIDDGQATIRLMQTADASTFIHETGHAWLEELMGDARDERAPGELRGDAKTTLNWLGLDVDADSIPTRAHEKFARGFERYLMEGRAPAAGLARVFDQFKQWLTQIYQTVARLRSPITDDIRHVYDRLLAVPGREPVIGADMEIPRNFADEHEALVDQTTPEMAHGAAERVRAEADRVASERDPEVHDELVGRRADPGISATETAGRPPEGGGPGGDGAAAGPRPNAAPAPEPAGAVGAGRGETAPQGAGMVATAERPFEPAGAPAETRFSDKAGNIRLDLLGTPDDVNQAIRDTAAANEGFIGARRGVISDPEALRLADALGMDASDLNRRKIGQAFNAEQVVAARKLLIQSATAVRDIAAKAAVSVADADVVAFATAMDRHRLIQEQVSGITAEAGRALRAFRDMEGMKEAEAISGLVEEATGRTLFQWRRIAQAAAQLSTPGQVSKLIANSQKTGFFDWLQSYWVNAKISGPATHGTYMVGNSLLGLFKATAETTAQAAIGAVREAIAGTSGTRAVMGEIPAQLYAMMGRAPIDAWQASWSAFLANETVQLPGERIAPGTAYGKGAIPGVAGTVLQAPSRVVTGLHSFTRVFSYETSIAGQAYRVATHEGLTGNAFEARVNQLTTSPTQEMMAEAIENANENAMMRRSPFGALSSIINRATNWGVEMPDIPTPFGAVPMGTLRPFKYIDPFVRISSNVLDSSIVRRTPFGLLSPQVRADLSGANGARAFDQAAGRMLAGTMFYAAAGGLAYQGLITGSGPDDPRKAAMLRMTGWMPHALKIGDVYYDAHRLGVLGMQLGIAGDLAHMAHHMSQDDLATVASEAVFAFAHNILDESFVRGPAEAMRALTDHDRYGAAYVRNFLSGFVPFDVGASQIARVIDPYTRQARTTMDAIKRKIPWESETLQPMRDIWGEPMPNRESVVPGLTAIYESKVNNDPVNQRMVALGMGPAWPERKIRGIELTPQQYDDYSRSAGRLAKMQLDKIVTSPGFAQSPEAAQREVISKTITGAREASRAPIMMQNNGAILKQAAQNRSAGLHR